MSDSQYRIDEIKYNIDTEIQKKVCLKQKKINGKLFWKCKVDYMKNLE